MARSRTILDRQHRGPPALGALCYTSLQSRHLLDTESLHVGDVAAPLPASLGRLAAFHNEYAMTRSKTPTGSKLLSSGTLVFSVYTALLLPSFDARASDARLAQPLAQLECTPARIRPLPLAKDVQAYRVDCAGSARSVVVVCQQHTCLASQQRSDSEDHDAE